MNSNQYFIQSLRHLADNSKNRSKKELLERSFELRNRKFHNSYMPSQTLLIPAIKIRNINSQYGNQTVTSSKQSQDYSYKLVRSKTVQSEELANSAIQFVNQKQKQLNEQKFQAKSTNLSFQKSSCAEFTLNYSATQRECVLYHIKQQISINKHWKKVQKMIQNIPIRLKSSIQKDLEVEYQQYLKNNMVYGEIEFDLHKCLGSDQEEKIINAMKNYLTRAEKNLNLLISSTQIIILIILNEIKMQNLIKNRIAYIQIESHWKILATQFKLRIVSQLKSKYQLHLWKQIENNSHFLDLEDKENELSKFVINKVQLI